MCTRSVRKLSSHFEYLENRSRDLGVTSQRVREILLRIREQSFSRGASTMTELVCCVTVAITNLPFNGDFTFRKSQKSQGANPGLTDLGDAKFCQKSLHESCKMDRRIVVIKLPVTTSPQLRPFSSYCIPQPVKDFNAVLFSYCPWIFFLILALSVADFR